MYRCYLRIKNMDLWLKHLQRIKEKYPTMTEKAIDEVFSFPFELEWISINLFKEDSHSI